jgi:hypothetical protein
MVQADPANARILILTPIGRDGAASADLLNRAGLQAYVCRDLDELTARIRADTLAVLLAEEALFGKDLAVLSEWVRMQPPWSDLPFVVLTGQVAHSSIGTWRHNLVAGTAQRVAAGASSTGDYHENSGASRGPLPRASV